MGPDQSYSAWAITDPNATIYTGDGSGVKMSDNQIIGALADKLGIKVPKGGNTQQLVLMDLVKVVGVNSEQAGKNTTINDVISKLGANGTLVTDPWAYVANQLGVSTTKGGAPTTMKVTDAAGALRNFGRDSITTLQQQLYNAGYFGSDVQPGTATGWTPGNVDVQTQQAFGQLLMDTANANKQGTNITWQDMLSQQTAQMNAKGGISALVTKNKTPITVATEQQLNIPAIASFEARLGRAPTAAELSGLTASFDAEQTAHAADVTPGGTLFPDQNAILQVPGVESASQAAANYAMKSDPTGYQGHQMANAVALIQNAMVSNRPLGADPNITSAARPL
jgi:hypothetical protein